MPLQIKSIKEATLLSVTEYAEKVKQTRQAILYQIKDDRLPEGVTAKKVGSTWIINV